LNSYRRLDDHGIMQLSELELWILFIVIISIMQIFDLGLAAKIKSKIKNEGIKLKTNESVGLSFKQSLVRFIIWITFAGIFAMIIFTSLGIQKMLDFVTGYVLEESLSVDNMLLFLLVFTTLGIHHKFQQKILSLGILSAIMMRIIVIMIGSSLLQSFHWMIYIFGFILLIGAFRMILKRKEQKINVENNFYVKILKKIIPIQTEIKESKFLIKKNGVLYATPLLIALIIIEMTDLVFAMDSIPAVLAITSDPFIVITSNVFAISGLRALYFLISDTIHKIYFLKIGLIILLFFIAIKMITSGFFEISTLYSFIIIVLILVSVIIASLVKTSRKRNHSNP